MSSNEKTIEKEENIENFKALQKRFFKLGITFLIVAIGLYVLLHSLAENPHIIIEFFIFAFAISSVILIFIGLVMTKDTNWVSLVGSTVFLLCCLLVLIFYPDQEFQKRLNIISLVAIIGTLLFGVFDVFINAVFFPSKNAEIRQSVDFVSNRFAVDVLTATLIIGTVFGTIAYLFFVPNKDISLFFGGIDIKTVAIATAGLVTFFWAAKAAKNKSIELEEKKQDGKRRDKEIKMAEARDTAQLIAKASELLGSENDAQKYAGLSFLNRVASQKGGPLQKEAFDLLADFILSATDITTSNKTRMRAIGYVNDLLDNQCGNFKINEFIKISGTAGGKLEEGNLAYKFDNLNVQYIGFQFSPKAAFLRNTNQHKAIKLYSNCDFIDFDGKSERGVIDSIYISNCKFENCKIDSVHVVSEIKSKEANNLVDLMSSPQQNEFIKCNFTNFFSWSTLCPNIYSSPKKNFKDCYYIKGFFPYSFDSDIFDGYLVEVSSQDEADKKFSLSTY